MEHLFEEILEYCGGDIDEMLNTLEELKDMALNYEDEQEPQYIIQLNFFNMWGSANCHFKYGYLTEEGFEKIMHQDYGNDFSIFDGTDEKHKFNSKEDAQVILNRIIGAMSERIKDKTLYQQFIKDLTIEEY